jgi:thiol:disulfide interchange protein
MSKLKKHIIMAVAIYFFDVFFFNQGIFSVLFLSLAVIFFFIPQLLFTLFKRNKELAIERLIRTCIYIFVIIAVFFSVRLINNYASFNARKLVKACNDYHAKYNKYPDKLEELVPEFLSYIPKAKPVLMFNNFNYFSYKDKHVVWYVVLPPYGRHFYNLEKGTESTRMD